MQEQKSWSVLSPSPLELEKAVQEAGLGDSLHELVPASMPAMPPADEPLISSLVELL